MKRTGPAQQSARTRLALRMRAERALRGLSQEELADMVGLHRTYIGSLERAERNVSIDNVDLIAGVLEMDVSALLAPV
jgi:transcriptional regulator with XRE-family HTH domain